MMRMPINARATTPPITAPTIRPVDGFELLEDVSARAEVGWVEDCEFEVVEVPLADDEPDVATGFVLANPDVGVAAAEVTSVVEAGGAIDCTTLLMAEVMTAVGIVIDALERIEVTSPAILDNRLSICLPCSRCLRCTRSAPMLPAARQ